MNENQKLPRATAERVPIYHRYLGYLKEEGCERISSTELSEAIKIDSATIRRDFSNFGALGKRGYGYDVEYLYEFFSSILHQDELITVGLVGVGNLGRALLAYNFKKDSNIKISHAFDVNPEIIDADVAGIPVHSMDDLEIIIKEENLKIVVLTVPMDVADEVTERLVEAGVEGILNFTPLRLSVPADVKVNNVDLTKELQNLVYATRTNLILPDDLKNISE